MPCVVYTRQAAPEPLQQVEVFCNSARFLYSEDAFGDLPSTRTWLREHGWHAAAARVDEETRQELAVVREAIRSHLAGHAAEDDLDTMNRYARAVLLPPQWAAEARPFIGASEAARASDVRAVLASVLGTLAAEELAGHRDRLKVCHLADCRWVYYDRSPGNNSVWCSMDICGARHKMRSYRERRSPSR